MTPEDEKSIKIIEAMREPLGVFVPSLEDNSITLYVIDVHLPKTLEVITKSPKKPIRFVWRDGMIGI